MLKFQPHALKGEHFPPDSLYVTGATNSKGNGRVVNVRLQPNQIILLLNQGATLYYHTPVAMLC